jgi:hypothetical protein
MRWCFYPYVRDCLGAILAVLAFWATPITADEVHSPAIGVPATIVVTGKKPAADEGVKEQVETALHTDPYFYDGHVTVTVTVSFTCRAWFLTAATCKPRGASAKRFLARNVW